MAHHKIRQILPKLLQKHFPNNFLQNKVELAIGYGSGVFPQSLQAKVNTIDLLFVVKSAKQAHQSLLESQLCLNDYSGLSYYCGAKYLNLLNNYVFPIHFNHPIIDGIKIKYGVVESNSFEKDLTEWNLLTLAGRLHKPVWLDVLQNSLSLNHYKNILSQNYRIALSVTLLIVIGKTNNRQISLAQLYQQITQISYSGDIRNSLAIQNKFKVSNIVKHNYDAFHNIYFPILQKLVKTLEGGQKAIKLTDKTVRIHYTPQLIAYLCSPQNIPVQLNQYLTTIHCNNSQSRHSLGTQMLMNGINQLPPSINKYLTKINRKSSILMAMQNLLGSSFINNLSYIFAKVQKRNSK